MIDHNTVDQGYNFGMLYAGAVWLAGSGGAAAAAFAVENFSLTNTLAYHRDNGLMGEDAGTGTPALTRQTQIYRWTNNVLAGAAAQPYPDVTWRPTVQQHQAQFNPDYTLVATSTYRKAATDGSDSRCRLGPVAARLEGAAAASECACPDEGQRITRLGDCAVHIRMDSPGLPSAGAPRTWQVSWDRAAECRGHWSGLRNTTDEALTLLLPLGQND